jgi:hypothetical protein
MLFAQVGRIRRFALPTLATSLLAALLPSGSEGVAEKSARGRMGQVVDWSSRHVLYPQGSSLRALSLSERDPRAHWNYLNLMRAAHQAENERKDGPLPERRNHPSPRARRQR